MSMPWKQALLLVGALSCVRCAAAPSYALPHVAPAAAPAQAPVPLERSVFARDPGGQLTEDALQRILSAPIEIALPARVGVLPIIPARDARGPGPSPVAAPPGAGALANALRGAEPFSLVTEVMPIPSGALGMEALREVAARYHLRYLLLYREEIERQRRPNGWAAGYPTLIGALFLPGQTLRAAGYVEASLLDCKTGILLFTVRHAVEAQRWSTVWLQDEKLTRMQDRLATGAAEELAQRVRRQTARYAEAVKLENPAGPAVAAAASR